MKTRKETQADISMGGPQQRLPEPQHTPTRCKNCKWIDRVDTKNPSWNFKGVEFCQEHGRAVNAHEMLLQYVKNYHESLKIHGHTDKPNCCMMSKTIAKAEGK